MSDEGSDDSPPRPKRRIKKVLVLSSESSSDSDASIGATGTRRKRLRVVSDAESNSSGSSVVRAGTRHRRTLPKLRDSDADSDSSTGSALAEPKLPPAPKPTSGFASDSSEGNSDKCSICLLRFTDQEVGTPETCEHIFCLDCITEWSKNVNTCPVDRITFNSIVVRVCAGGRVLRTEPVKVVERRSSVDLLVVEDPTVCEICGSTDNEETMLLCDGCDLGYHMQCLVPPLSEVPIDQWLCPNCDDLLNVIHLSEVDDLFSGIVDLDLPMGPRPVPLREPRNVRRSSRNITGQDEPSTSSGRRGSHADELPTTSRTSRMSHNSASSRATTRRRTTGTQRRRTKKRRSKTVIIEYEVQENGKFPVTKRITRKVKNRRTKKRQPRTAARRSYVRASVRAKLANMRDARADAALAISGAGSGAGSVQLSVQRLRAGIPALSLFGDPHQLDYFEEDDASEGATTAVVARPTSSIISAYRQARRKMISIPSPPHASAAPDLLSGILESQTLLHSKKSVVSIAVDGSVNIKLEKRDPRRRPEPQKRDDRVDLTKGEDSSRKAPSYPGQSRGGGWGGGYRGNYQREQSSSLRGGYDYQHGYAPRAAGYGGARRDEDGGGGGPRHYLHHDDGLRRRELPEPPRPAGPPGARERYGWQPYARHSLGGLDNPLDMRTAPAPQPYRPLPEPPAFPFAVKAAEPDRSEDDEERDADLVIDTEKYDPTEPTNDDDSGDDAAAPAVPVAPLPAPPPLPPAVQSVLAGLEGAARVPATVLDSAVRQVLREHHSLLAPRAQSDDDDEGDCPNFSIYSATSVHIANSSGAAPADPAPPPPADDMQDLVQEDDDPAPPAPPAPPVQEARKKEDEYKEKVSKRCPITTNTRNPIKIKLHTPSLIKRRVSLYDDDEPAEDDEPARSERDDVVADDKQPEKPEEVAEDPEDAKRDEPECKRSKEREEEPADDAESEIKDATEKAKRDRTPEKEERDRTPEIEEEEAVVDTDKSDAGTEDVAEVSINGDCDKTPESIKDKEEDADREELEDDAKSEAERSEDEASDREPAPRRSRDDNDDGVEKMTESISETEDERSYTPCLDENKSKDTSLETEKDKGLEGLDTEMISEDEGNEMFSDQEKAFSERDDKASSRGTPPAAPRPDREDGEIPDKKKDREEREEGKKKKKKDSKKEGKEKGRKKKGDVAFKKLSKSGKERNYRERDKEKKKNRDSDGEKKKRKEKRKDLERYDVRTVVSEKRRKLKDPFGRDVSPRRSRSASPSLSPARAPSASPGAPRRRSLSRARRSLSRARRSLSRARASISPLRPRVRRSPSPRRSPSRTRLSLTPRSATPRASPSPRRRSAGPARRRRRSGSRPRRPSPRRRRSGSRGRKRRRSASKSPSPKPKTGKRRKRARSERAESRRRSPRRKSPRKKRTRRRSAARAASPAAAGWSPASVDSRLLSPRTPPPEAPPAAEPPTPLRRRDSPRPRHRRVRDNTGPSKEVFTSGDNILVSVSFKDQDRASPSASRLARRSRRRGARRRRAEPPASPAPRPVAIIDLERSPFRELTPEQRDVIVLSDSDQGKEHAASEPPPAPAAAEPQPAALAGPKTPPSPRPAPAPGAPATPAAPPAEAAADESRGPSTPPEPPSSPDAYDPFEPTRSASGSPPTLSLEAAKKTNLSADDVIDRRPIEPMEKVLQLLQSTRDAPPSPPPGAPLAPPGTAEPPAAPAPPPAPRIVLPEPAKLFLAKPSPIKSDPIKPMQNTKISRLPLPRRVPSASSSPYSPGESDFGELFEPPRRRRDHKAGKARGKGKMQVGVKIDSDSLKILEELPSSAVELQVKSKFLKKLNRQERVVEEVKLVLKPHYNKKHVTKDEYKDILRRAVPKICHNKTGEINPTKIQALVEAYVKKFRKKHKQSAA